MKLTDENRSGPPEETPTQAADSNVTIHRSSPGRAVFTEQDNTDGWIATDYTVDLLR